MRKLFLVLSCLIVLFAVSACEPTSDDIQRQQQERILMEGTSQVGMPAVKNFRERKLLKDIIELRDQTGLVTYTYLFSEMLGKFVYLGESIGYPIPYATQFTNPSKIAWSSGSHSHVLPQADPNGLFSPASAEGTWVMMKDPHGGKVTPIYCEPKVITLQFKLPDSMCINR
jgi:hypothetical protein